MPSFGGMSVELGGGTKACLVAFDNGVPIDRLTFLYNPTEVSTSKTASWTRPTTKSAESTTGPEFTGSQPQVVEMELFFDAWNDPAGDVSGHVNRLLSWTKPSAASRARHLPNPPLISFEWGMSKALADFRGYLKSVTARYTMFNAGGAPIRATCKIRLEEVPSEPAGQNPTSGSPGSRRSRELKDGDSLASVAFQEYGEAALWRGLAIFNEIDDPFAVRSGAQVLVPPFAEAKRLAARERD
jgi:nucleoid-associated protein YgaU